MSEEDFNEPKTIGLSPEADAKLDRLKSEGYFQQKMDAYKFAVGLALAKGEISPPLKNTGTIYSIGNLDQDKSLYEVVKALRSSSNEPVYKTIERLAEWGVTDLFKQIETGNISLFQILSNMESK